VAFPAALAALALLAGPAAPPAVPGIQKADERRLSARLRELTFKSPLLSQPTHARVLLPRGYARSRRRYPVLYLLHGGVDDYRSWTLKGDAEALTGGLPLIVVMPDTGPLGGYVDWFRGEPWESFHITRLVPWVDRNYRTVARRSGRALAGLSMGGFGAMSYAARHPDLFGAAASFSGAVDSANPAIRAVTPTDTYGPFESQEVRLRGRNPVDLASNLRGVRLTLRTGNGSPGGPLGGGGDGIEFVVHKASVALHERLGELGIGHVWDDYGPGYHGWPYWQRDLKRTLPWLMRGFRHPRRAPVPFSFRAIERRYGVYGWRVRLERPVLEWSELRGAGPRGFTLTGSGTARVATARLFAPGTTVAATVRSRAGVRHELLAADRRGRVGLTVELGPANKAQEYRRGARTRRYRTRVRLSARF
jgi:S-formylglutathione hydrolase FrmB